MSRTSASASSSCFACTVSSLEYYEAKSMCGCPESIVPPKGKIQSISRAKILRADSNMLSKMGLGEHYCV